MKFDNKKILIATGGTGGHVFPAYSLAKNFMDAGSKVSIISDIRGFNFLKHYKNLNIKIINSSTIFDKSIIYSVIAFIKILLAFLKSLFYLLKFKPNLVFGMGGYSSFPVCIAAKILNIPFIIYENNLLIGKTNKYLLPLSNKIFISYNELEGIDYKYKSKIYVTGNIIREEILNYKKNILRNKINDIKILILGGSQAAKVFGEKIPIEIKKCVENNIKIEILQQCLPSQMKELKIFYNKNNIKNELFNFSQNIIEKISKSNLVITRSGSSMIAELINCRVPFISIPLPTAADNHQLKNSQYFKKKGYGFLIEENEIENKLFLLIKSIHNDKSILTQLIENQKKYSDDLVFNKINAAVDKIINEKN